MCCRLIATALELEGFGVKWTTDPLDALELLRTGRYAVLVSDVNMPHMLGTSLAAQVRKMHPSVPILLVTAFGDRQICAEAQALGAALVAKPVQMDVLAATVRELLQERVEGRAAL